MANVTLSVRDRLLERAREVAANQGTSLNALIRDYLEQLVGGPSPEDCAAEFRRLSLDGGGHSRGWKFNRDEIHER